MSDIVDSLAKAVEEEDFETLESTWLELLEAESISAEPLADLLAQLVDGSQGVRALDLALALAPDLVQAGRHAEALPLLRAIAPAAEGNEEVRNLLIISYRHVHSDLPHLDACMEAAKLLTTPDLAAAVAALDRLLSYKLGDYFYHPSGWGTGPIVGFDILPPTATIDFERTPGHSVPLGSIEEIFVRLDPDDFRVLRLTASDRLRQMAQDDPPALARAILKAQNGRITQRGLRELVAGELVPETDWSRWWTRLRTALTRDPLVDMTKRGNPVLTLRDEALTYEDEMRERFALLLDLRPKTELVREYMGHMAKGADRDAFLAPAARELAAAVASADSPGAAFEAALLLGKLRADAGPHPTPEEIVAQQDSPMAFLHRLTSTEARRRAFELLRDRADDASSLCRQVLLDGPKELWDAAAAQLPQAGEPPSVASITQEILDNPKRNLQLFGWLCRHLLNERWRVQAGRGRLFDLLLTEGDELARRKADQFADRKHGRDNEALAEIRQAIRTGGFSYFDELAKAISEAEAGRLLFRIRQSSVLSTIMARTLESKLVRHHPRLLVEEEKPAAAGTELIYATQEGIARRHKELDRLVNVLIPENAKAIGRAAAMGDISDNADWRAAIQERDRLNALRSMMASELQRARPIEPGMLSSEDVSIGSRVTVEDAATGEQATYTLLGPWDGDAERGIIAYAAPLAQAFLRHHVGDEVVFEHAGQTTTYRILSIENGLEDVTRDA